MKRPWILRLPARRGLLRAVAGGVVSLTLGGCVASQKHVEMIEADVTRRGAWTDEQVESLRQEMSQVRAENEALRIRMDEMADQLVRLGGEVSSRITELEAVDRRVEDEVRQSTEQVALTSAKQARAKQELLNRLNLLVEEMVRENELLVERIDSLENSAFTFGQMHEVQPGESVASIGTLYGVTPSAIVEANGLPNANLIQVGQQLLIPGATR